MKKKEGKEQTYLLLFRESTIKKIETITNKRWQKNGEELVLEILEPIFSKIGKKR